MVGRPDFRFHSKSGSFANRTPFDHPKCRPVQITDPNSNFNTKVRRDWYAYAVLSALPWVGRELYEKKESELDRMLGSLEGYIKRRNKIHHGALRVFRSDAPHPQEEVRGTLQKLQ